jgi:hypothetical protein
MPMRSFKIERKKKQSEAAAPDAPEESTAEQAVESPDAAGDGDEAPRSQPPPGAAPLSAGQPAPAAPELSRRERRAAERQAKRAGRKGGQPDTAADEPTAAEGLEPGAAAGKAVPTLAIETPEPQPSAIATPEPEGGKKPGLLRRYMNYRNASIARQKEKKARKQDERRRREEERRAKREQKGAKPSPEPAPPPAPEPVAAAEAEPAMAPGSPEPHPVPPPGRRPSPLRPPRRSTRSGRCGRPPSATRCVGSRRLNAAATSRSPSAPRMRSSPSVRPTGASRRRAAPRHSRKSGSLLRLRPRGPSPSRCRSDPS